jgi:predicted SprT family Zn-dependent metalloprotease
MSFRDLLTEKWNGFSGKIENNFGRKIEMPEIVFDLTGRTAGMCVGTRKIRLNSDGIRLFPDYILNQTFPHEVSHFIIHTAHYECRLRNDLYSTVYGVDWRNLDLSSHGAEWQRVCYMLGIQPNRCHNLPLPAARETRKFLYICGNGHKIVVGLNVHKKVQELQRRQCQCGNRELIFVKEN